MYLNKDRYGYYTTGDFKTYSKIEALEIAKSLNTAVVWHFNDQEFSAVDWTVEPVLSLPELYRIRAEQIRNKYDYIVLFYSGGADSHNMLHSFLDNGLKVDEIAQFHSYEGDGNGGQGWDSYFNAEIKKVAVPETQKILEQHPYIKHRIIDLSSLINDTMKTKDAYDNLIYMSNKVFSPNQLARTYLRERIEDYKKIINSGKSLCFVYGAEKPYVTQFNGKFGVRFYDMLDNAVGVRTQQLNRPWEHDEFFYWSPEIPELIIKQAHLLMKALKAAPYISVTEKTQVTRWETYEPMASRQHINNKLQNTLFALPEVANAFMIKKDMRYELTPDGLHRVIYHKWDPDTFTNGKPWSTIFSWRDGWWFNDKTDMNRLHFTKRIRQLVKTYGSTAFKSNALRWRPGRPATVDVLTLECARMGSKIYYIEK